MAILTNKYVATLLVGPRVPRWVKHLEETVTQPDLEKGWTWISWEHGLQDIFTRVTNRLIALMSADQLLFLQDYEVATVPPVTLGMRFSYATCMSILSTD
jgi:hypothetical protein